NCRKIARAATGVAIFRRAAEPAGPTPRSSTLPDLFLHETLQLLGVGVAGIDVTVVVDTDAFQRAGELALLDERGDFAVPHIADPNALLEARIELLARLGVRDVDHIVLVDVEAAWPTELLPLVEQLAVLVEDLDTAVGAVRDEQAACGVEGKAVRHVE